MSDNEIRQILIQRKKDAIEEMKREQIRELAESIACWACWAGLGYMAFLGAYMIG